MYVHHYKVICIRVYLQVLRSVTEWSAGTPTEHSILNACLHTIKNAEHFIYVEVSSLRIIMPGAHKAAAYTHCK